MIQRLLYVSDASMVLGKDEVAAIAAKASANNHAKGVTGALAFNGEHFCQVLEGEADVVDALMSRISADPRHENVVTLSSRPVATRRYAGWYMKHVEALSFDELIEAMAT